MRKLKNVIYAHTRKMSEEAKDDLLIPNEFNGSVAIESWEVNGVLKRKGVCVPSVINYILGLGEFKEVGDTTKSSNPKPQVYIEDAQPLTKEGIRKICENDAKKKGCGHIQYLEEADGNITCGYTNIGEEIWLCDKCEDAKVESNADKGVAGEKK